jgi:hypothetical protein
MTRTRKPPGRPTPPEPAPNRDVRITFTGRFDGRLERSGWWESPPPGWDARLHLKGPRARRPGSVKMRFG